MLCIEQGEERDVGGVAQVAPLRKQGREAGGTAARWVHVGHPGRGGAGAAASVPTSSVWLPQSMRQQCASDAPAGCHLSPTCDQLARLKPSGVDTMDQSPAAQRRQRGQHGRRQQAQDFRSSAGTRQQLRSGASCGARLHHTDTHGTAQQPTGSLGPSIQECGTVKIKVLGEAGYSAGTDGVPGAASRGDGYHPGGKCGTSKAAAASSRAAERRWAAVPGLSARAVGRLPRRELAGQPVPAAHLSSSATAGTYWAS